MRPTRKPSRLSNADFTEPFVDIAEAKYSRKDGGKFWAKLFVSPVRDSSGKVVQHFASLVDLTRHKEEQAYSQMLINELNHRVKNTLATVQSMVRQALRSFDDPTMLLKVIETRLMALSRSHDLLSREDWKKAGLHDLISDALVPFAELDGRSGRFTISGENIHLPPRVALALGIALNELGPTRSSTARSPPYRVRFSWAGGSSLRTTAGA